MSLNKGAAAGTVSPKREQVSPDETRDSSVYPLPIPSAVGIAKTPFCNSRTFLVKTVGKKQSPAPIIIRLRIKDAWYTCTVSDEHAPTGVIVVPNEHVDDLDVKSATYQYTDWTEQSKFTRQTWEARSVIATINKNTVEVTVDVNVGCL